MMKVVKIVSIPGTHGGGGPDQAVVLKKKEKEARS